MNRKNERSEKSFFRTPVGIGLLFAILVISALLAWFFGSVKMSVGEFFSALLRAEGSEQNAVILYSVRLPRILGCILSGIGLAVSGVLLQTVTDNQLASPSLIGVNQGAGFSVALLLTLAPSLYRLLPLAAFVGAVAVTLLILAISRALGNTRTSFVLSGIAIGALFSAFISFLNLLDEDTLVSYNAFSVGSCADLTYADLLFPAIMIFVGGALALLFSSRINALMLGDLTASSLGIRVRTIRMIAVLCSSACAAAVVSFAGLLGFVGLVVPNLARRIVGNNTKYLLLSSSLMGAILVLMADLLGRVLASPSEIPVGIMMACVGAPFFLAVLLQKGRRGDDV